ncbi:RmlC-like cupin [Microstroma glucosiphilum]|uniref:RmlC-like cupin n=1 Tax=Pseudomicrostroma glucosiphilum TaxID=1684307 RepID=A0A316UAJ5_9BASI|nr:RmlC-like cupin [Pseudomicrostroma glucosiphilum]PWN21878.1 RmlC-like cupin [Pseudomicrostroma glucosiphilum]
MSSNSLRLTPRTEIHQGPLKAPRRSYILSQASGESFVIPSSKSNLRLAAGKDTTDGAFAIAVTTGGPTAPVVPHSHREAHDTWLCLRGAVQVWCEDTSRILYPGDFASVPPGYVHTFAQRGAAFNDFFGLITPGGWEGLFKYIGNPVTEDQNIVTFPSDDQAPFPVERFIAAIKEGADVVPAHGHKLVDATPFTDADVLPDETKPYFLKADTGDRYFLGGQQWETIAAARNTGGKFSIGWLEGSCLLKDHYLGSTSQLVSFEAAHTYLRVIDGTVKLTVKSADDGQTFTEELHDGEAALVASGDAFGIEFTSPYGRVLVSSGTTEPASFKGGLDTLFAALGNKAEKQTIVFGGGVGHPSGVQVKSEQLSQWAGDNYAKVITL